MDNTGRGSKPAHADGDPRPAAVTFVTTELLGMALGFGGGSVQAPVSPDQRRQAHSSGNQAPDSSVT